MSPEEFIEKVMSEFQNPQLIKAINEAMKNYQPKNKQNV